MIEKLKNIPSQLRPSVSEGVRIIIWFFLIAALVIFALHSLLSVLHPYQLDYGEAPLIDQAMRMAAGENIYRASITTPPYTIANYPPLYVISLIPFLNWFDSPFHMARVVSVIATLLSAIFIGMTIQTMSKNRFAALIAATFFLASPYVVQWSGLARIDSLALAFAMAALFILARWPNNRWAWLGGGLLLTAAAYTRQSYALAAPLGAFVWLWTKNKRRAIELALLVGGLGIGLFVLINALTRGGFYYNIVTANVNEFGWDRLRDHLSGLWDTSYIILLMGALFLLVGWRNREEWQGKNSWPLLAPFFVGAFLSALTIGKIGSNINYFLELAAALALIAGIVIAWSKDHLWWNAAVVLLLAIQIGLMLESSMEQNVDWILTPRRQDFANLQFLEQEVKKMGGAVLADEYMGMLTQNDRPLYIQPFEVTQLANAGMWDQQPLLDEIAAKDFDGILIHHFGTWQVYKERWTAEMVAAIEQYYRPVKTLAGTVIYIPRGETDISGVPAATQNSEFAAPPLWEGGATPIGAAGFMGEPYIAVDPTHPDQLAAIATRVSKQTCELPNCKIELVLYASFDGGETWQSRATFGNLQQLMYNGKLAFDSTGLLNIMGIRNDSVTLLRTSLDETSIPQSGFQDITSAQVAAQPWIQIQPQTDEIFVSFDPQENDLLYETPGLKHSSDGVRWSVTAHADLHISAADIFSPRATPISDVQVLFGEGERVSLVWVWDADPWRWPRTVWMANSSDGGVTFGEPTPILETWGPINSASAGGSFAIAYRIGEEFEQQLAVAVTSDNGQTWTSVIASGNVNLYFDPAIGPGIDMAEDGTIDLVFYTYDQPSDECLLNVESWQWTLPYGRIDPCEYNVFYTYSKDGAASFAAPLQLNDQPIRGDDFVRLNGASQVGSHLVVASGSDYAYPVWVGTPESGKTQVYTAKIER